MNQLLMDVYGNWEDPSLDFPIPLSAAEAGPSMVPYGKEGKCQRRYLWTDAWGVLCFVSLAMRCDLSVDGDENRREQLLEAGEKLVKCVHGTLGQPRGDAYPMRMVGGREGERKEEEVKTPHGFIGLRTGKERALPGGGSDAGMTFDGMYYHYLDKVRRKRGEGEKREGGRDSCLFVMTKELYAFNLKSSSPLPFPSLFLFDSGYSPSSAFLRPARLSGGQDKERNIWPLLRS